MGLVLLKNIYLEGVKKQHFHGIVDNCYAITYSKLMYAKTFNTASSRGMSTKIKNLDTVKIIENYMKLNRNIENPKPTSTWFELIVLKETISQILTILLIENTELNPACKSVWKRSGSLQVFQMPARNTDGK